MRLASTITIDAPIERVFDCWAALERAPEHQKPTLARTKLTDGPVRSGTRYEAVDKWPGRRVRFEMEITVYERPTRIGAHWDEPMTGAWDTRLRSEGGATVMDFGTTIKPTGLMGLMAPLMKPWAARQLRSGMTSFKNWVESGGC
jgi:uncharacterized protein YndB with AHSA1/START domain